MGYIQAEEVTLPTRFLLKTAHLVAVLALVFDVDAVVSNMTKLDQDTITGDDLSHWNKTRRTVLGLSYASFACFGIEYITMFMGVTIFMRLINTLNILAHGTGLILIILLQVDNWNLQAWIAFFTVFNASPAVLELMTLFFSSNFSYTTF